MDGTGGKSDRRHLQTMRLLTIANRVRAKMGTGEDLRSRAQRPRSKLPPLPTGSSSPGRKEAVGKSTKWKWELVEPSSTPLRKPPRIRGLRRQRHFGEGQMHSVREEKPHNPDNSPLSDVIQLAQRGDVGAFELIYRVHCRRVYALCLRMVKEPGEAEDLTQEAFMQLFRK